MLKKISRKPHQIYWSLILLLLTLHLGVSEFFSIQFITFAALLAWSARVGLIFKVEIIVFFTVLFGVYVIGLVGGEHDFHRYLVSMRTILCATLCYVFVHSNRYFFYEARDVIILQKSVFLFGLICCGWAMLQFIDAFFFKSGVFYIPSALYALEYGTLSSLARFDQSFIRPTASFSEPSALAVNGVMIYCIGVIFRELRILIIGVLVTLLSISITGYVFLLISSIYYCGLQVGVFKIFRWRLVLVLLVAAFVIFFYWILGERIIRVFSGEDASSIVRIFNPIKIIANNFDRGLLFGANESVLMSSVLGDVATIFDNWFFNQILLFGVLGGLIILVVVLFYTSLALPFVIMLGFANGDMFYYDRALMMAFFFYCLGAYRCGYIASNHP